MATNLEKSIKVIGTRMTKIEARHRHVYSQIQAVNRKFKDIYRVWDGFFKLFFTALLLYVEGWIWWTVRGMYYVDGKWSFSVIIVGGLLTLAVSALVIYIIWHLTNLFLKRKMEPACRDGDC